MFYGQGAGGDATASAVLGDLVAVARNRVTGVAGPGVTTYAGLPARPIAETPTRYHVSLDVADKPGVLATVAQEFARHGVSIATVRQDGHGDAATLVIVTHSAPDAALSATVAALREMPAVRGVTSILRVEGLS
jgi:homoserine dehydrogenase